MKIDLTAKYVKSVLDYDPETGIFTWTKTGSGIIRKIAGSKNSYGYINIGINRKIYRANRLAWLIIAGEWPKNFIDHINGIKDDNRWCNLREATNTQNKQNGGVYKNNNSGTKGVYYHKGNKKYFARITVNKEDIHLGYYEKKKGAIKIRKEAELKYFGKFAPQKEVDNG